VMFRYTKVISISISIIFMSINSISIFLDTRMRCYATWLFSLNQFINTYFSSTSGVFRNMEGWAAKKDKKISGTKNLDDLFSLVTAM
jgi:hypothetical protein